MEGMATLWNNVGFFAGKSEAKAERLEADWAVVVVVEGVVSVGDDGDGRGHGRKGMGKSG
jgi:hypothetical protein